MSESQTPESQESPKETSAANSEVPTDRQASGLGCGTFIVGIIAIGAAVVFLLHACTSGMSPKVSRYGESDQVIDVCRMAAEKRLKAPETAEYSEESTQLVDSRDDGGTWIASGTIRSENSFGGTAISHYTCDATYKVDGEEYSARARVTE